MLSRFDFVELFVSLTAQSIAVPGQWHSDRRHHIPPRHRAERAAGGGELSRYRWRLGCILLKMPAISMRAGARLMAGAAAVKQESDALLCTVWHVIRPS